MRVFVTGASGWIGSAVVPELLAAGHRVVGLARSDNSATALAAAGVEVRRGSLDDLETLQEEAAASDGVIHLAFNHEIAFSGRFQDAADADRRAIQTFGEALAGSDRPLVLASGTLFAAPGKLATERDGHDADTPHRGGMRTRWETSELTLALADRGVRSSVLRLPPTVHGDGDRGFMATIVGIARDRGISAYIGDGANRWPAVHRLDAALLFRRALEAAPAGTTLHAVADQGIPIREIATVIGRHLDVPVTSIPQDESPAHFAWLDDLLSIDAPASSKLTRDLFDWEPAQPGLIDDLELGHYFGQSLPREQHAATSQAGSETR
jgi:nucleoside-diphosphate-sugar epimerase